MKLNYVLGLLVLSSVSMSQVRANEQLEINLISGEKLSSESAHIQLNPRLIKDATELCQIGYTIRFGWSSRAKEWESKDSIAANIPFERKEYIQMNGQSKKLLKTKLSIDSEKGTGTGFCGKFRNNLTLTLPVPESKNTNLGNGLKIYIKNVKEEYAESNNIVALCGSDKRKCEFFDGETRLPIGDGYSERFEGYEIHAKFRDGAKLKVTVIYK